ncbi:MAG TPA: VWA domain-containing protein [Thermoanaerobaculia bacterium]|nr:VWA domain-containing protein [Thermoanaerobaculia bacterium]
MRIGASFVALVVAVIVPAVAFGAVEEAIQVVVVEVPVTVTDSSGKALRGLTAENFQLLDNGKPVAIEHFEVIDLARVVPDEPLHPAARRNFLLLFDLSNSSPGNIGKARKAAEDFVQVEMSERDLAAVATFTVEQGVRLLTSFTGDRALLKDAIVTLGHPKFFRIADPLFISATVAPGSAASPSSGDASEGRAGVENAFEELVDAVQRADQQATAEYRRARLKVQLEHFGTIAKVLDALKGQKQVILFSEGFDARVVHGREEVGSTDARAEAEAAYSGEVWRINTDQRYGSSTSMREMNDMAEIFRRADVVLHAIDIQGLRGEVDAREGFRRSSNEGLFLLSNPTGGKVFKNANDLGSTLRGMLEQQEVIYVLGFRAPPAGRPGQFHDLKVRTTGIRGARVTHRAGYYEPSASLSAMERTLSIASILVNDIPVGEIGLSLAASPFPGGEKKRVPVLLEIPGRRLLEGVTGSRATSEIFIYAFDQEQKVRDFLHQTLPLDLDRIGKTIRDSGLRYYGTLMLEPGKYEIKALVRVAESNRGGFRKVSVEVPRFDGPTAGEPMLISENDEWLMLRAAARPGAEAEYPFLIGDQSFVPEIEPAVSGGSSYKVALFTYHVPPEELQFKVAVVSDSEVNHPAEVGLAGRTSPDADGAVKYLFDFSPGALPTGRYRLQVTMLPKDMSAVEAAMPFVVGVP